MKKSTGISDFHTYCTRRGEVLQIAYANRKGDRVAFLTMKGNTFYLYGVNDAGTWVVLGKGKDPHELEERCEVRKLCGAGT